MMSKRIKSFLIIAVIAILTITGGLWLTSGQSNHQTHASSHNAYDLSEWQGTLTNHKAKRLKHEVGFVIIRAQYGSDYTDQQFSHNKSVLAKNHIPYGVYSYSRYRNSRMARNEARILHSRAPKAKFYVNDIEENDAGGRLSSATKAWAHEMKHLTKRPVVLYSSASFIQEHLLRARKSYNAIWLADYTNSKPVTGYKYDLWQFTSSHYSKALRKRIDDSRVEGKPLTFWIGHKKNHNDKPQVVKSSSYNTVKNDIRTRSKKSKRVNKHHRKNRRISHHKHHKRSTKRF